MPTADEIRVVRTLIPDTDAVFGAAHNEYLFTDGQITDFLTVGAGSPIRAAAYANYAIATSEVLISKVITTQDLQTNGASVANSLINKANGLFQQADKIDAGQMNEFFDIVFPSRGGYRPELTNMPFDSEGNILPGFGYGAGGYGQ
jgi:hypothetical protein